MDEALCAEASRLATGAHIHEANTLLGIYRNSVWGAERLAALMRSGTCWTPKPGEMSAADDLAERIASSARYATKLQAFVARRRLDTLPAS